MDIITPAIEKTVASVWIEDSFENEFWIFVETKVMIGRTKIVLDKTDKFWINLIRNYCIFV